jgi:hypothetical protein
MEVGVDGVSIALDSLDYGPVSAGVISNEVSEGLTAKPKAFSNS